MIKFKLMIDDVDTPIFDIELYCKVNIILGDSGSGKSYLFESLKKALNDKGIWKCISDINIRAIDDLQTFLDIVKNSRNNLIVVDEDTTELIRKNNKLDIIKKSNNYFLLLDRQFISKFDTNVNALFKLSSYNKKGIRTFRLDKWFNLKADRINDNIKTENFRYIITEDIASGKIFWKNMLDKLELIDMVKSGNGGVYDTINQIMMKDPEHDILVALDYDMGASTMCKILGDNNLDKSRIHFIPLESFEELICNSEFILSKFPEMKEYVFNYKNHVDCSYVHLGRYFSFLLFKFVKAKFPLKENGSRNATQFYEKGMKNFKECFLDDCCCYNKTDCKMFSNTCKKDIMLSNKFEALNVFKKGGNN